ncbi:MAG: ABC transporter ATP-binding protein [Candidatus Auribacterota bacterium]
MTEPALRCESISYSIKDSDLLSNVSFSVQPGEFVSIIGPNGAGKTTLLRCIMRILKNTGGSIYIHGKDTKLMSQRALARQAAYIPQSARFEYPYSVEEFVAMGRYPYLTMFESTDARGMAVVEESLHLTGTASLRSHYIPTLSGGETQKVMLAGALAQSPSILLLDEVTSHLDPKCEFELISTLDKIMAESSLTIISVTHDINFALRFSDKILALVNGKKRFFDKPALLDEGRLHDIYNADFDSFEHPQSKSRMLFLRW